MPNESAQNRKPEDTAQTTAAAIDEATRAVNEAARRSAEASSRAVERQAEAAAEITRAYLDEWAEANRRLVAAWGSGVESGWRAALDVQNAILVANSAFLDAAARGSRLVLQQWTDGNRQALLEPVQAMSRAAEKLAEAPSSTRERAR